MSAVVSPPKKPSTSVTKTDAPTHGNDVETRLAQIRALWVQLTQANERTEEYRALVQQIRKEADAFRKLVDARRQDGRQGGRQDRRQDTE
jgi:hypothetical protein